MFRPTKKNIAQRSSISRHQSRSHFQLSPDDGIDDDKSMNDDSCDDTDEIPIWVRGEQRWISGITDDTTCGQLVEALLRDDGMDVEQNDGLDQYVITERWRRVEQVLNSSTKVLKIWVAWGAAQSEVKYIIMYTTKVISLNFILHMHIPLIQIQITVVQLTHTLQLRLHRLGISKQFLIKNQ